MTAGNQCDNIADAVKALDKAQKKAESAAARLKQGDVSCIAIDELSLAAFHARNVLCWLRRVFPFLCNQNPSDIWRMPVSYRIASAANLLARAADAAAKAEATLRGTGDIDAASPGLTGANSCTAVAYSTLKKAIHSLKVERLA